MTAPLLEACDVHFAYEEKAPLLEAWSEQFERGEMVAITGPSGRGKSTLLYLLGLMVRPDAGEVRLDGSPASRLPDHARASLRAHRYGFVFQDAVLDPSRSVLDNVTEASLYRGTSRRDAHREATALLARFGVRLRADARPGQISGGQAQRVALCRALLGGPSILLADEPTGNLDGDSAAVVLTAMRAVASEGGLCVVVTHDPATADRCDRRIVL